VSPEGTDFLYPFIEGDERDAATLLTDLAGSAAEKAAASGRLRDETLAACDEQLDEVAGAMAERLGAAGVLFTFGNGGSSTDAATVASLFAHPPVGVPLAARCLASDEAVLTALSNDVGFELVFSRQIIAHATECDVAFGISTSGDSENVLRAFAESKRRGLLTVGLAGYEGGRFAGSDDVDHCIVVHSDSVHRTQETQAVLSFELWDRVQRRVAT
jgi:D-sedoheptulose 7-phosphate isomerase